jgi:phosphate-selective porin OprO/OprP
LIAAARLYRPSRVSTLIALVLLAAAPAAARAQPIPAAAPPGAPAERPAPPLAEAPPAPAPPPAAPAPPPAAPAPPLAAPAPPFAAPAPPPAAPAPPPAAPPPSLVDVAQAEELARSTARRVDLWEQRQAARAREAPAVTADEKGFGLRSADGAYVLHVRGILQADSRWFVGDAALAEKDTFLIRRFRPSLDGTLFGLADFRLVPDFAGGQAQIYDAYIDLHPAAALRLRVGKFKTPLGLERLQQDADLPFVERALTQNLTPQRDVGAALWGELLGGLLGYSLGLYNGAVDGTLPDIDTNYGKDVAGRLLLQPLQTPALQRFGLLGLHLGASRGYHQGLASSPQLAIYKSAGQNAFFNYLAPASDPAMTGTVVAHLVQSHLNPGAYYYFGPLGILGEMVWSRQAVQKGSVAATLTNRAAHVTASWVFGGKSGYDGVTPARNFDAGAGALGALELALRWNWLRIDDQAFAAAPTPPLFADATKSASGASGWAAEVNYVPRRTLHLDLAYERTSFSGGAPAGDRRAEQVVTTRAQVNF